MNPAEIMAHQPMPIRELPIVPARNGPGKKLGANADAIVKAYARRSGASVEEIMSKSRLFRIARARWGAMFELYATGEYSYPTIGMYFGLDHSTVMHGVKEYVKLLQAEAERAAA